jgi:AhpD family alkylhydroperoxidase
MLGKNQSVERAPNENFAPTACAMHALKDHFTTDVGLMSVECRGHRFHAGHECLLRALLSPSRAGRRRQGGGIAALTIQPRLERTPDATASDTYLALTQAVSAELSSLGTSMPKVMKAFGHLGRAATAEGALDRKTQALIALPLSVAVRCDPCIGFHTQVPARLGAPLGRTLTRPPAWLSTWAAGRRSWTPPVPSRHSTSSPARRRADRCRLATAFRRAARGRCRAACDTATAR